MVFDPAIAVSYYPDTRRKVRPRIVLENIVWALRYGEVNWNYFTYGLDRRGRRPSDYIAHYRALNLLVDRNRATAKYADPAYYAGLLKDKQTFSNLASSLGYPCPRILGLGDAGIIEWFWPAKKMSFEDLTMQDELEVFCKPMHGGGGKNAFALSVRAGRLYINDDATTVQALRERMTEPMIFQAQIVQHPALRALHESSINTVRLITVLSDEEARPFTAALRIGAGGIRVDNWAAGGMIVYVDMDNCVLRGKGFFKRGMGQAVTHTPDTSVLLDGYHLPGLREGIDVACRFHRDIGGLHTIGWDIALTLDGPQIVEANTYWNEGVHLTVDEGFGPRLLALDP